MFGFVDRLKPHTVIRVNRTVELFTVYRTVLTPGDYAIQGDIRGRFRNVAERRKIVAGFFTLEYIEPVNALNTPEPLPPAEPPVNHPDAEIEDLRIETALILEPVLAPIIPVIAEAEAIVAEAASVHADTTPAAKRGRPRKDA